MTDKNLQQVRDALAESLSNSWQDQARKVEIENILATLDRIMGDYVLVPKEPTEAMEDALDAYIDVAGELHGDFANIWRDIISAAPKHGGE